MQLCVLGSGSQGNCTLLSFRGENRDRFVLIDCGLSRRAVATRLGPLGVTLGDISDILITHFDSDHFQPAWTRLINERGISVHVHRRHRAAALRSGLTGRSLTLFDDAFELSKGAFVEPHLVAHDALGTVAYVFEHRGARLGFATDLGRVTGALCNHLANLHALAIESNYDREMQLASARPAILKSRIMGGRGHLSNDQSLDAVLTIHGQSSLEHVVPLHLSRECNDPRLIKRLYGERAPDLLGSLTITNQYRATPLLTIAAHEVTATPETRRPGVQTQLF